MAPVSNTTGFGVLTLTLIGAGAFVLYYISYLIYNIYFHPLSQFPGPKLWTSTVLTHSYYVAIGDLDVKMREMHRKYGDVVRYKPDALSFKTAQAWQDIYGHGHSQIPKDHKFYPISPGEVNIIHSNDADHTRMRRLMSHAFSEKALHEQEFVLKSYIDLLIEKLQGFTDSGAPADLVKWYNFVTFDMIGELAFGQPFGCLQTTEYHFFVSILFSRLKMGVWLRIMQDIPALKKVFKYIVPKKVKEQSAMMVGYSADTTRTRIAKGVLEEKKDFLSYMLKAKDEKGLSEAEIISNARILVIAGSETTATLLSGTTYWLLTSPEAYRKVTEEVRKTFASEGEITVQKVTNQLPYMMACLEEGFRMYPPVPSCLPRRTRAGTGITKIGGYEIPENTSVGVHASSAYWAPENFYQADSFLPERWLAPASSFYDQTPFQNDNRAVLQPFSLGPRNCIGRNLAYAEMRLILARMLWNFDMELCEESREWCEQKTFALWDKPPLMVRMTKRKMM